MPAIFCLRLARVVAISLRKRIRQQAHLARLVAISLVLIGGFFYTQGTGAQIPPPDLVLELVSLSGDMAVVYRNDGTAISNQPYVVSFQWVDVSGVGLAPKQTLTRNTLATRGREILPWNTTTVEGTVMVREQRCYKTGNFFRRRTECNYIQVPRTVNQTLAAYRAARPNPNALLAIMLDDGNRIAELGEANNSARVGDTPFRGAPPAPLAELAIPRATFDGNNLFVVIQNQSTANISNQPFDVGLQWLDQAGVQTGDKRFIRFKNLLSGRVEVIDSKTAITVLQQTSTEINDVNVAESLSAYLLRRPVNAVKLQVTVDERNQILENTKANNVAMIVLPPLRLPDLAITKQIQTFDPQQLAFSYANIGQAPLLGSPRFSFWFEWVDASGARIGNHLYWQDQDARSLPPGASAVFLSKVTKVFSLLGAFSFDQVLQNPPVQATHLKITIDGPNVFNELNETNNSVLLAKPTIPLPDLAITKQVQIFNPQQLVFSYVNASTVKLTQFPTLSLWFEWVDASGARFGELYWQDRPAASVPLGATSIFSSRGAYVSSARAFASVDSVLKNPPAQATHLKITIDGPNRFRETDENNNTVLLSKPVVPMPDLSLRTAERTPTVIQVVLQNEGTVATRAPEWEFRWLGAEDKVLETSSRITYSIDWPVPKQPKPFEIPYAQGREDAVNRFLKNPPADAQTLEIVLDPANQIAETREDNNTFRIKLDYPDLAFGEIVVREDALNIEVENQGTVAAAPTDIWLQWWSASAPLRENEAWQIASTVAPGASYAATLSLKGQSPAEKILASPPEGATRLRLFLDGSRKVEEINEQNNDTFLDRAALPKPAEEATPELTLTLALEVIREHAAVGTVSSFAGGGLTLALAALLAFGFMIHGHQGGRNGAVGFFSIFPLLFTASNLSYMYLRRCGPQGCSGQHFDRYRRLKNATRASLGAAAGFGILKIVVAALAVSIIGPVSDISAQSLEVFTGFSVRASMVVKNSGTGSATALTARLACPSGSVQRLVELNGKTVSADASSGIAIPDLGPDKAHSLKVSCKVTQTVAGSLRFQGDVKYKEGGDKRISSNAVEVEVRPKLQPEGPPDLTVAGVGFLPKSDVTGDSKPFSAAFTAIVKNIGESQAGATSNRLRLDVGSNGTWDFTAPTLIETGALGTGEHETASWTIQWTAPLGAYTFEICADAGSEVTELSEDNNCVQDQFTLQEGVGAMQEEDY